MVTYLKSSSFKVLFLSLILVLSIGVLVACGNDDSGSTPVTTDKPSSTPTTTDKPSSTPTTTDKPEVKEEEIDFPTKEITLVVPYGPGGGFDTAARMIAPFMEKYLGEDASIIIENVPGGGGNVGLSQVQRAEPDGHKLGIINVPSAFTNQVLDRAEYNLFEMEYIGRITSSSFFMGLSPHSKLKTLEDIKNAEVVNVGMGNLDAPDILSTMEALGIKGKTILHNGSSEAILAAIRGDVDIVQFPIDTMQKYFLNGDLIPVVLHSDVRAEKFPDVPTITELGYPELMSLTVTSRTLITSPGVPIEILTKLRDSFDKAVKDPEYLQKMKEADIDSFPLNYEKAEQVAKDAYDAMLPYKELLGGAK